MIRPVYFDDDDDDDDDDRFERIVSGRFSPLTAPLPLTRPPAPLPLHRIFSSPAPAWLLLIRISGLLCSIFRFSQLTGHVHVNKVVNFPEI